MRSLFGSNKTTVENKTDYGEDYYRLQKIMADNAEELGSRIQEINSYGTQLIRQDIPSLVGINNWVVDPRIRQEPLIPQ